VATSAFQVEGHVDNDMTEWEKLGQFKQNGKNPVYDDGSNHWKQWKQDFAILKNLKVNAYRFSIEWSRIQPQPDLFDEEALASYEKMVDHLLNNQIIPVLTLHHFTHPKWFHDLSPWHKKESIDHFCNYAFTIINRFSNKINWFITFNEPLVWSLAAYGDAKFPPGKMNLNKMMISLSHMLEAHCRIYDEIKRRNPKANIGIAKNFIIFNPLQKWNLIDIGLSNLIHTFYNIMVPKSFKSNRLKFHFPFLVKFDKKIPINNRIDFWGVNYYYRMHVHFKFNINQPFNLLFVPKSKEGVSDLGWENYSKGLLKVFKWLLKYGKYIIITENGTATDDELKRINYLKLHLSSLVKGMARNYPIFGYFYWSFIDNYEWLEGKSARFGLIGVDYGNNYKRYIKDGAKFYSEYINNQKA
jgi:beta-glucosidase